MHYAAARELMQFNFLPHTSQEKYRMKMNCRIIAKLPNAFFRRQEIERIFVIFVLSHIHARTSRKAKQMSVLCPAY